ncbi:MAG: GxxExxY protein, partial [Hymenobacteraceae bacterium]|nr:GxxExxY protein [Hymenobacteraceae bacterium]MDX5396744.1 GxxExxY protein [Hymenobacteraceae bacterium]MDX5512806.1 GxxExxY protein [Hymenobacteraceae bacterium]
MIKPEYPFSKETSRIIGAAMEVHRLLGNGFQEVVYQRALEYELELQGLGYMREAEIPIFYKEKQVGSRRVDFLVEGKVLV